MSKQLETYILVLAATHPSLTKAYNQLVGEISQGNLEEYLASPIYHKLLVDLSVITQSFSTNYNKINITLNRLTALIDYLGQINYEYLSDDQRESLPTLAKRIDEVGVRIREEIYPLANDGRQNMIDQLNDRLELSISHLEKIEKQCNNVVSEINKAFGIASHFNKEQLAMSPEDLKNRLAELNTSEALQSTLNQSIDTSQGFLEGLLMMNVIALNIGEASLNKVYQYLKNVSWEQLELEKVVYREGAYCAELNMINENVQSLEEELLKYPEKKETSDVDLEKDLNRLTKQVKLPESLSHFNGLN